ncbi:beta-xylosidase [Microcoleus sp. bin38.metabat.b11b12b14.051]|uniref:GH39 family glycosyl hydrolase n=1 Tax=Microcoleus sp. bin38.metabat.b11b12b14.051 TaxID=2742709 RepID=UPI0025FEACC0|nr:beta-xylosidase [Microcoleus sp. bin38.metabat.b11b12b14.051]
MQFTFKFKPIHKLLPICLAAVTVLLIAYFGQPRAIAQLRSNVIVDFRQPATAVTSMSGILHGIDPTKPPDSSIKPLQPKLWRAGRLDVYDRVIASGAEFQLLVSDLWGYGSNPKGWPYQNYPEWEAFIRQLAQQNKGKKIIWDIWNEPDLKNPFWKGSRQQFFETYKRAYRILREELGPSAMIGGPSISTYNKEYLTEFLDYCKANKLEVNFLAWHELNDTIILFIDDHVIDAKRNFQQSPFYRELKLQKIYVNEIVGELAQYQPGEILGYLSNLEYAKADGACRACWDTTAAPKVTNCFNNTLTGMVAPNTFEPRAAWWAYKAYADGVNSRVLSRSDNDRLVALASKSNPEGKAQVLLGYFDSNYSSATTVTLNLANLQYLGIPSGQKVTLKLEKIPNNLEAPVQKLVVVKEESISVVGNNLTYVIPNFKVHEGYLLTIKP